MNEDQVAVLAAMTGARALTCGEIAYTAVMPKDWCRIALAQLEQAGVVKRLTNSPGRPTHWVRADLLEGLV